MKITGFHIVRYGRLADFTHGPDPLGDTVVVLGRNESGKSTLFSFLCTQLYGFERGRGSRDLHPYAPWCGGDIEGEISALLSDGSEHRVNRRLLSQPTGQSRTGDTVVDLANRPTPWVRHLPERVFREVFALRLEELAHLEGRGWKEVEERLLGGMGATDLRSVRETIAALEEEAKSLWRPDRRGKPRSRELHDRRTALNSERRDAVDRARELQEKVDEMARAESRLQETRLERETHQLDLERIEESRPALETARRIRALEREAGDPSVLDPLPADVSGSWSDRKRSVASSQAEVEGLEAQLAAVAKEDGDGVRPTLSEEALRTAISRAEEADGTRARIQALESRVETLSDRRDRLVSELFEDSDLPRIAEAIDAVPDHELGIRIEELERNQRDVERLQTETNGTAATESDTKNPVDDLGMAIRWILGGFVSGVIAFFIDQPFVRGGAAASAITCIGRGGYLLSTRKQRREAERTKQERLDTAIQAVDKVRTRILDLLGALPLRPDLRTHPGRDLPAHLQRCREAIEDASTMGDELTRERARLASCAAEVSKVIADAGLSETSDEDRTLHLRELLTTVLERREGIRAQEQRRLYLTERRSEAQRSFERVQSELEALRSEIARAYERATGASVPDIDDAIRELESRQKARRQAATLREELERSYPDALATLDDEPGEEAEREVEPARARIDDSERIERRARVRELDAEVQEWSGTVQRLRAEIAALRNARSLEDIEGEIRGLDEALDEAKRERDRLTVLAHLLRSADRRFREEHQPELIQRASDYLARITDDRYDRILMEESGTFMLEGPDYPQAIPVGPPISTGTQEQLYLSLRLAALDQLDAAGERLPLFVDELFVNWDEERMQAGLSLLREIGKIRQIFLFTCHPYVAEAIAAEGAMVVELPAPPPEALAD